MKETQPNTNRFNSEFELSTCSEINAIAISKMHEAIQKRLDNSTGEPEALTFFDIDETLVDTIGKFISGINRGARILGFNGELPPQQDILENGGTHYYASIFRMQPEDWEEVMIRIRRSPYVNEKARSYHHNISNFLNDFGVVGYISARPATEKTFDSTYRDLFKSRNFPERPVVLRPETFPITEASTWKSNLILDEFGQYTFGAKIILVDDSISTARAVTEINRSCGQPKINQILYKGPITVPVLESGKYQPKEEDGIYVSDWDTMQTTFDRIKNE